MSKKLLLIDKPSGVTSYEIVRYLKKTHDTSRVGHAGTLDPMATGLMIVGVDEGTKLLTDVIGMDKEYIATIQFGVGTDSGDVDGEVVTKDSEFVVDCQKLQNQLESLLGSAIFEVPKYSAVKQGGVALHKKVRRGEEVIIPKREMVVYEAELLDCDGDTRTAQVHFKVASGTYIRSLGEELGRRVGTVAHLTELRRTKVGEYDVVNAQQLTKQEILSR